MTETVAVFGAYGHTGRFVVAELRDRGYRPLLVGRDAGKLQAMATGSGLGYRAASADDPASLDGALRGTAAVVNCAGPFAATAGPVIEAALRAGIPYVDVAAEIEANLDTFTHFAERARAARAAVVPAMAFYGGLGDLLTTAAMADWTTADEVHVAYGLSSWYPTAGTRASGTVSRERRDGRRVRYTGGRLEYYVDSADLPTLEWDFPAPTGPLRPAILTRARTHGRRRRSAASASCARVSSFSFARSSSRAASHSFTATIGGRRTTLVNLVAEKAGLSPREEIVVMAHRDDSGVGQGANDNASGTAALIELARGYANPGGALRARPTHRIVFLSTDGGALGGLGAAHFAADPVQSRDVVAVVNLTAIGGVGRPRLELAGDSPRSPAAALVETAATRILDQTGSMPTRPTSHGPRPRASGPTPSAA